jgi:hypothetical protein
MSQKTCSRCDTTKDENLFIKKRNICKECSNEYKRKSSAKQKTIDPETIVQCTKCKEEKKYALFIKGKKQCKACDNVRRKQLYELKKNKQSDKVIKICTSCKINKKETEFNPTFSICKVCQKEQKNERINNLSKDLPDDKDCIKCGLTQDIDQFRIGENVCSTCTTLKLYEWRKDNPDKFEKICKNQRMKPDYKEKQNKSKHERYHNNPIERIGRNYRQYLRDYIFKDKITKDIDKIVDLPVTKLKDWLEYNFQSEMTWENYGTFWNIDHVTPCSSFDLEDEEQLYECFSWKNTLPVYCKENLIKHTKIDPDSKGYMSVRCKMFMNGKNQYFFQKHKSKKQTTKTEKKNKSLDNKMDEYFDSLKKEKTNKSEIQIIKKVKFKKSQIKI